MQCLTAEQIELLAREAVEPSEAAELRRHVEQCDTCRRKLDECLANEQALRKLKGLPASGLLKQTPTTPLADGVRSVSLGAAEGRPERIASYEILDVLGQGGMGVVYLAEQDKPRRRVALKVVRPGVVTTDRLKRFEHEAQILGHLQHTGIAQIYEAGAADTGHGPQPYFAMELIKGVPLTEYAKENRLGTRARLLLLATVCDAVQHAHQKGIIHRDLKPETSS